METTEFETRIPLIGKRIPNMLVQTTQGVKNIPDDYRYKWIILFCHPGNFTYTCITEFISFAKRTEEFKKLNAELIGFTIDQKCSNIKCTRWLIQNLKMKIPFPVVINDKDSVTPMKEIIIPCKGAIKIRGVFIIDPEGIIRLVIYYQKKICRQVDEVLRTLKDLQKPDKIKAVLA